MNLMPDEVEARAGRHLKDLEDGESSVEFLTRMNEMLNDPAIEIALERYEIRQAHRPPG